MKLYPKKIDPAVKIHPVFLSSPHADKKTNHKAKAEISKTFRP
jgi:hypothetical protein